MKYFAIFFAVLILLLGISIGCGVWFDKDVSVIGNRSKYEKEIEEIVKVAETIPLPDLYNQNNGDKLEFDEWLIRIERVYYGTRTGKRYIEFTITAKFEGDFWFEHRGYDLWIKSDDGSKWGYWTTTRLSYEEFINNPQNYEWLLSD